MCTRNVTYLWRPWLAYNWALGRAAVTGHLLVHRFSTLPHPACQVHRQAHEYDLAPCCWLVPFTVIRHQQPCTILHASSTMSVLSEKINKSALTEQSEAAAAGNGFDVQVCDCPRDDGLHLAPEELHPLWPLSSWLIHQLRQRVLQLQAPQM